MSVGIRFRCARVLERVYLEAQLLKEFYGLITDVDEHSFFPWVSLLTLPTAIVIVQARVVSCIRF